jgi:23S rRNA (guanosine2251-2'-O)-methyltransferase
MAARGRPSGRVQGSKKSSAGRAAPGGRVNPAGRKGSAPTGTGGRSSSGGRVNPAGRKGSAPTGSGGRVMPAGRRGSAPARTPDPKDRGLGGEQVEGRQAVRELFIAGLRKVREVWVSSGLEGNDIVDDIIELAESQRVPVHEVSRKRLDAEARSEAPQGVLAKAAPIPEAEFETLLRRRGTRQPFLLAVDGVTDPGNLGALLRSAEGAGVTGVVLPRHRAVHVTPTVAKAAAGAVEHVPMAVVPGLPTALASMRSAGIWIVGLDDAADRTLFELGDLAVEGICLVLGAEGSGLSRLVRERCDLVVSIPMRGQLSSLNVSVSAALACYEVTRQRLAPAD